MTAFIWQEHISRLLWLGFLSAVPVFEGRYALVIGQSWGLPVIFTFALALFASTVPMFFILLLVKPALRLMHKANGRVLDRFADWIELRGLRGAERVGKRGLWGLFLFVAAPVPGAGVWTGTLISVLLGYDRRRSMLLIAAGNVAACAIMTVVAYVFIHVLPGLMQ